MVFRALRDGSRRDDRRTVAVDGEGGEQAHTVDLRLRLQLGADRKGGAVQDAAQRRPVRRQQQAVTGELGEVDGRPLSEGMAFAGEQQEVLGEQWFDV